MRWGLSLFFLASLHGVSGRSCDAVADCGARSDNVTDSAPHLSACAAAGGACGEYGSTITFTAGASFMVSSLDFSHTVNLTLSLGAGTSLYGVGLSRADLIPLQSPLPPTNMPQLPAQWRALLYARNASGFTIEGPSSAIIDGSGASWWAAFANGSLANQRPKLVELVDSTDVVMRGLTFRNSPFWSLHTLYCSRVSFVGVAVQAPRLIGNTDGIDPDSCSDVLIDSCDVDVGDDGISIKSDFRVDPDTGAAILVPSERILVRNTTVHSRNVAIGSSTYGNITDVLFEGGRIGDDAADSLPWAVKIKTHTPNGGVIRNITFRGVHFGAVGPTAQQPSGGTAIYVSLTPYNNPTFPPGAPTPASSSFEDITLQDIDVKSARVAGSLRADAPFLIQRLSVINVSVGGGPRAWSCARLANTTARKVTPPLPSDCGQV